MKQDFKGWETVCNYLRELAENPDTNEWKLNTGQRASLHAIAERLPDNGVLIADEVGMGKTRIAVAAARSVISAGGRVAILVPPGLGHQWQRDEISPSGIDCPSILRSLWQYLQAWEADEKKDQNPWFNEQVVLISHAFTNWRLGENSEPWRWTLLPELYAQFRKTKERRYPRGFLRDKNLNDKKVKQLVKQVAQSICKAIPSECAGPLEETVREIREKTPWPDALNAEQYARNAKLRPLLERAVGLGLGTFDLVIIDEAHKSRGQESGLSRLLDQVVLVNESSRRLAMTATPVELDVSQWHQTLSRIGVDPTLLKGILENYSTAVNEVRQTPCDEQARAAYKEAAQEFQHNLSPFLLRRDKREDAFVQKFAEQAKCSLHEYRKESEVIVTPSKLSTEWRHAVCAAESLSIVTSQSDDPVAKRLRLTLGNGHGIATLLDQMIRDSKLDKQQGHDDFSSSENGDASLEINKRHQRAQWWRDVMCRPFNEYGNSDAVLYEHPAILAAVESIEDTCSHGEKVLVFGRFTRPLQALTNLLNAREMLRCLDEENCHWAQAKVHEDEWPAIQAAHRQMGRLGEIDQTRLDQILYSQYQELENIRRQYRTHLISNIAKGFDQRAEEGRASKLFVAFRKSVEEKPKSDQDEESLLALLAKAMQQYTGLEIKSLRPNDYMTAFMDLITASSDRDEGNADGDGTLDDTEAENLWGTLEQRLREEFSRPKGGFARLMNGGTKPETRRFLQVAFNRINSYPKVLVSQSTVGREGLNLHKACRTVLLLHPEWNPGVVEQQIGRVDRVGSFWEKLLDKAIEKKTQSDSLPRVRIQPVIFRGTYDEKNWQVLRNRWDDLRAQLHGIVITPSTAEKYDNAKFADEINSSAPNFSPLNKDRNWNPR